MSELIGGLICAVIGGVIVYVVQELLKRRVIRTSLAVEASGAHHAFVEVGNDSLASYRALLFGDTSTVAKAIETARAAHSGFVIDSPDERIDTNSLGQEEVKRHRLLVDRWKRFLLHEERYRTALQAAFDELKGADLAAPPSSIAEEYIARARGEAKQLTKLAFEARDFAIDLVEELDRKQNQFGTNYSLDKLTAGVWTRLPDRAGPPELPVRVETAAAEEDQATAEAEDEDDDSASATSIESGGGSFGGGKDKD